MQSAKIAHNFVLIFGNYQAKKLSFLQPNVLEYVWFCWKHLCLREFGNGNKWFARLHNTRAIIAIGIRSLADMQVLLNCWFLRWILLFLKCFWAIFFEQMWANFSSLKFKFSRITIFEEKCAALSHILGDFRFSPQSHSSLCSFGSKQNSPQTMQPLI